ncbi:MAG: hypothetical protein KAG28_04285 [Cocleimonas sp.]|nr:hypothetical protein [Cocleimonas sp.]
MKLFTRYFQSIFIILLFSLCSSAVFAAELPWSNKRYSHFSDQEPLSALLSTLASSQSTQISVSKRIKDIVSVHFKERTTRSIFDELVKTHGLIWYYDGGVLYVSKKDEIQTGSVSLKYKTSKEFSQSLRQMGILDNHFYWVESEQDNAVYFKGPERFVSTVLKMVKVIDKRPNRARIYKWTDKDGIPSFTSKMPKHYKNRKLRVVDIDSNLSLVGDSSEMTRWDQ